MKKLQIVRESPNHDELVELYKKERDSRLKERYHALFLMHELKNCTKVAEILKKSRATIQIWVKLFNEKGMETLPLKSPPGRVAWLTDTQMKVLKEDLLKNPRELGYSFSHWEGKTLAHHINEKFNVRYSVRGAQKLFRRLGFTLQRPRYQFSKADPEKQEEFKNKLKKKWMPSQKQM